MADETFRFDKCPVCGGELAEKEVVKLLRGGPHTAVLKMRAEVRLRCSGLLYSQETVQQFEEIKAKLKRQETEEFKPMVLCCMGCHRFTRRSLLV